MKILEVNTNKREELVDITDKVVEIIRKENWKNGILFFYVPHTTAGIAINENYDPSVCEDISDNLKKIFPPGKIYKHTEGNADAHIKSAVVGNTSFIFLENGKPAFGTWQGIFLCEFDGPRKRKVYLKFFEEK
ncbi:MAG: secondary thiamine-phosphate synthase enzyme YjbQ [candidate division WOR-3 bacterium]